MKNYLNKFKENLNEILEDFKDNGIHFKITKDYTIPKENPRVYFDGSVEEPSSDIIIKFNKGGLKRWYMGISGAGPDSGHYTAEKNSMIVYLFHSWVFDRWSPFSADIRFDLTSFNIIRGSDQYLEMLDTLCNINQNPIKYYINIIYENPNKIKYPNFKYLRDWYFYVIKSPISKKLRWDWSPLWLYYILKFISWFDPRCKMSKLFEDDMIPRYNFGFLATKKCSEDDRSFERFYYLYSTFPNKLKYICKYKLFDALYNVSDYSENFTKEEIDQRLMRGVIL